jgi:hypothetical protein
MSEDGVTLRKPLVCGRVVRGVEEKKSERDHKLLCTSVARWYHKCWQGMGFGRRAA